MDLFFATFVKTYFSLFFLLFFDNVLFVFTYITSLTLVSIMLANKIVQVHWLSPSKLFLSANCVVLWGQNYFSIVDFINAYHSQTIDAMVWFSFLIISTIDYSHLCNGVPNAKAEFIITFYVDSISKENACSSSLSSPPSDTINVL